MFRAARQDWYEQGDIWHHVANQRPLPANTPTARIAELATALQTLITTNPAALIAPDGPLAYAAPWTAAFITAGQDLSAAASNGILQRGIRDVLAHHVIFHWNRLGLAAPTQGILAHAARDTVMHPPGIVGTQRQATLL